MGFVEGMDRTQASLLPPCIEDYVAPESLVRIVDAFVGSLDLAELGFARTVAAATGRPGYHPGDMLRLYVWGYLNQVRSSRHLERACTRDLEALWLMKRLAPDYRTIAAFRHDNPEAIVAASGAFIQFCLDSGLITGRMVALDGTKMRAVASPKNIAGAERLARDLAHTEKEVGYYLDRLDVMDEAVAQGFDDQPIHRQAFTDAIAALGRRKDRLARRQEILTERDEKASPMRNRWATPTPQRCPATTCRASWTSIAVLSSTTTSPTKRTTVNSCARCHWLRWRCCRSSV